MQTIKMGSKGPEVGIVQRYLNQKGFDAGAVDNIFGIKTQTATKAFQKAVGVVVDGIIGPKTWAVLQQDKPSSPHFKLEEFTCKDRTPVPIQYYGNIQRVMNALEKLRAVWGKPIIIHSGYRTPIHNKKVG